MQVISNLGGMLSIADKLSVSQINQILARMQVCVGQDKKGWFAGYTSEHPDFDGQTIIRAKTKTVAIDEAFELAAICENLMAA